MSDWIKVSTDLYRVRAAHKLTDKQWLKAFHQAAEGRGGPLAEWIKPCNGRLPASQWVKVRSEVYARDDYTCQYCGDRGGRLECDHVIALSRGGSNDPDNLKTACFKCNRSKRNKTVEEWRGTHQNH